MEKVKLGDIFNITSGGTPSRKNDEYYINGNIKWVKTGDLKKKYIESTEEYITEKGLENSSARMYGDGTVLIAMYGATIGAVSILKTEACTNQACAAFVKNEKVIPEYLYYFLRSRKNKFINDAFGGAQPNISAGYLKNIFFNLIDLKEQKNIVDKMNIIEEIIDIRKKQIEELNQLIKSQFVEMFGDPFLNDKNWKTSTIGECCTLKSGNSLPAEVENEGGDVLYIKVGDMNLKGNEKYITTSSHRVTEKTAGKGLFELGTILFPKRGGAIGTNKKRLTDSKVCADLNIMGVTPMKEIISEYLFTYFLFIDLGTLNNGSSVPQINNKDIEPLIISIPPIELQNQFSEFVKLMDKQKFEIQKSLEEVQKLQESLMNKYFG